MKNLENLYSGNQIQTKSGGYFEIARSHSESHYTCYSLGLSPERKTPLNEWLVPVSEIKKVIPTCHECGCLIEDSEPHPTFGAKHFCDTDCEAAYAL